MACASAKLVRFSVCELYADGKESDITKEVSISKEESDNALSAHHWSYLIKDDGFHDWGIILVMFEKLYGFTIGPNGFTIEWDKDEYGTSKILTDGYLHWSGPREPAIRCGGRWWRIRRVA